MKLPPFIFKKHLLIWLAGVQLYDRAPIGVPSLEYLPPWREGWTVEPHQWKKSYFLGFLQGDVFRAIKAHLQRDAMKVFSSLNSAHRSWNEPSNVRDGDCRDGDKLLCNICPLKHEARKRERGVKCFTRTCRPKTPPSENLWSEVQLMSQIHDIYAWYGHSHP